VTVEGSPAADASGIFRLRKLDVISKQIKKWVLIYSICSRPIPLSVNLVARLHIYSGWQHHDCAEHTGSGL